MTMIGPVGKPVLRPDYYNQVVEVDGQGISARAMSLTPRLIRVRMDRSKNICVMDERFIKSLIV